MPNALSNPYEITIEGITCKCSPFGHGSYIAERDLDELSDLKEKFKELLFRDYDVEQSKQIEGIKVFSLRQKEEENVRNESKITEQVAKK